MTNNSEQFAWDALPELVAKYLKAHVNHDYATAVTFLADDATVIDDGQTFKGREAALEGFNKASTEFEFTTNLISVTNSEDNVWEVGTHVAGNFPGGEVNLKMIFTIANDSVQKLEITT